jgi:hypothetical protein
LNNTPGEFDTLISPLFINTTNRNWPIKSIGYTVQVDYELAAVPATRRSFVFGDPDDLYDGLTTHQLTDNDTAITITAIGNTAVLDTNNNGVGVNSVEDDLTAGIPTSGQFQRYIDGTLPTPESIEFSFDRDVSLESITLGNLELNGSEGVVLEFVSGTNPFTGLGGYSGDYSLGASSLTVAPTGGGQIPYMITYGLGGQDEILIEAGTVLSLTANPTSTNGFILDMITVNVMSETLAGDYNADGTVDAADYVIWRKTDSGNSAGYQAFRANFGLTAGAGGGSAGAIPEPGAMCLAGLGALLAGIGARRIR